MQALTSLVTVLSIYLVEATDLQRGKLRQIPSSLCIGSVLFHIWNMHVIEYNRECVLVEKLKMYSDHVILHTFMKAFDFVIWALLIFVLFLFLLLFSFFFCLHFYFMVGRKNREYRK